jgi:hypothetical protein
MAQTYPEGSLKAMDRRGVVANEFAEARYTALPPGYSARRILNET